MMTPMMAVTDSDLMPASASEAGRNRSKGSAELLSKLCGTFLAGQPPMHPSRRAAELGKQLCATLLRRWPRNYFFSGNLKPIYVPELMPISPRRVGLNSGIVKVS